MTYKIVAKTNGWIANRDSMFGGKCEVTLQSGMTLKAAQTELLRMLNNRRETSYKNWGLAVNDTRKKVDSVPATFRDGTRAFEEDGRKFCIEEETE